jgi:hypothetical protein
MSPCLKILRWKNQEIEKHREAVEAQEEKTDGCPQQQPRPSAAITA